MTLKAMPQADTVRNWLLGVIVAILAMGVFSAMRSIVVPVLFAVAVTILLWPVVERLSCRLPFALSVPVVLLAFALVAALVGALLAGSVQNMTRALPKYGSRLDAVVSHWVQFAREHGFDVKEVRSTEVARRVLAFIGQGFTSVLDFLGSLVLVVVLAIFGVLVLLSGSAAAPFIYTLF